MSRRSIPKSLRFEVFKRDKFTCQYCGKAAPDAVLEIDHIKPVSKGGTNDLLNLVTACRDCNRGKTNRELRDDSVVSAQKKQLDALQDRREQLAMMLKWREELEFEIESQLDAIESIFFSQTEWTPSNYGRVALRKLVHRFGFREVCISCELAIDRYYNGTEKSWQYAFSKVGGICYNRKKARENAKQDS